MLQKLIARLLGLYLNLLALIAPKRAGNRAFQIFSYPFATKLKPHQQQFLDSAKQGAVQFEGLRLATYTWGDGPEVILCLHGWQSNAFRWKKFVQEADKDRFTVQCIDAPGHGNSEGTLLNVPVYARLVKQMLEMQTVDYILGHSIACFAAMHSMHDLTAKRPKRAVWIAAPGSAEEFIGLFRSILGVNARVERAMRSHFLESTGLDISDFLTERYAPKMQFPALIIHDRLDKEAPFHYAERLHATWPDSDLVITEGLGHKMRDIGVVKEALGYFKA